MPKGSVKWKEEAGRIQPPQVHSEEIHRYSYLDYTRWYHNMQAFFARLCYHIDITESKEFL